MSDLIKISKIPELAEEQQSRIKVWLKRFLKILLYSSIGTAVWVAYTLNFFSIGNENPIYIKYALLINDAKPFHLFAAHMLDDTFMKSINPHLRALSMEEIEKVLKYIKVDFFAPLWGKDDVYVPGGGNTMYVQGTGVGIWRALKSPLGKKLLYEITADKTLGNAVLNLTISSISNLGLIRDWTCSAAAQTMAPMVPELLRNIGGHLLSNMSPGAFGIITALIFSGVFWPILKLSYKIVKGLFSFFKVSNKREIESTTIQQSEEVIILPKEFNLLTKDITDAVFINNMRIGYSIFNRLLKSNDANLIEQFKNFVYEHLVWPFKKKKIQIEMEIGKISGSSSSNELIDFLEESNVIDLENPAFFKKMKLPKKTKEIKKSKSIIAKKSKIKTKHRKIKKYTFSSALHSLTSADKETIKKLNKNNAIKDFDLFFGILDFFIFFKNEIIDRSEFNTTMGFLKPWILKLEGDDMGLYEEESIETVSSFGFGFGFQKYFELLNEYYIFTWLLKIRDFDFKFDIFDLDAFENDPISDYIMSVFAYNTTPVFLLVVGVIIYAKNGELRKKIEIQKKIKH